MQTIFYGAPGTGKSYTIDNDILAGVSDDHIFRITFYPDFSYSDFVGQLLPTVIPPATPGGTSTITYEFQKGVFTTALEKAYENNAEDVYLVIEEMSRGDCAAIFGDIFQLLDRQKSGPDKGYSRYFINNKIISKDIIALPGDTVKLPANFHILGTVNTSDQNVFVMDTAFKRRFDWEYVSPNPIPVTGATGIYENNVDLQINDGTTIRTITWVDFYQKLNEFIADDRYLELGEDRNNIEIDVKVKCVEEQTTQAELAEKVGTSPSYVNRLIKSPEKIVNKTFVQMMEQLGYDIEISYIKR